MTLRPCALLAPLALMALAGCDPIGGVGMFGNQAPANGYGATGYQTPAYGTAPASTFTPQVAPAESISTTSLG